jgi:hypothetical protein
MAGAACPSSQGEVSIPQLRDAGIDTARLPDTAGPLFDHRVIASSAVPDAHFDVYCVLAQRTNMQAHCMKDIVVEQPLTGGAIVRLRSATAYPTATHITQPGLHFARSASAATYVFWFGVCPRHQLSRPPVVLS